jgi:hypothetical protein
MAGTFTSTGSYSNLTRLELEQLRRGDYTAGGKALTIGDSGLLPEGIVGKGSVNAEVFYSNASLTLNEVNSVQPPTEPGKFFGKTTDIYPNGVAGSLVGPVVNATISGATTTNGTTVLTDAGATFVTDGFVQPGNLLLIGDGGTDSFATAIVAAVNSDTQITCSAVVGGVGGGVFSTQTIKQYTILDLEVAPLFAVPGSGPVGREQTFLFIKPTSTLNANIAPTTDQINADRLKNIIPPKYALDSSVDRADSIFLAPAPRSSLDKIGYRVVFYPDDGSGAPDFANPITSLNPVIDPAIPADDQRVTIDYAAGTVRFSCAPAIGGQVKVAGGVNATTGRLNLYAVFWTLDHATRATVTAGSAGALYHPTSTTSAFAPPARMFWDSVNETWAFNAHASGSPYATASQILLSGTNPLADAEIHVLEFPEPTTTSIVQKLNAQSCTIGDGTLSYGDFSAPGALVSAVSLWLALSSSNSLTIYMKPGTYSLGNSQLNLPTGKELIIRGAGRASTVIMANGGNYITTVIGVASGARLQLNDVAVKWGTGGYISATGTIAANDCLFEAVSIQYSNAVPLRTAAAGPTPYLGVFNNCEFNYETGDTNQLHAVMIYASGQDMSGFLFRDCYLRSALLGGSFMQIKTFGAGSTACVVKNIVFDTCKIEVNAVPSLDVTRLNSDGGVLTVNPDGSAYVLTVDQVRFLNCRVNGINTFVTPNYRENTVLLHIMPIAYDATDLTKGAIINTVEVSGGTWSVPDNRGSDFVPFFLNCQQPIVRDVVFSGGGQPAQSFGTSPGFRGHGLYTTAQKLALRVASNSVQSIGTSWATISATGGALQVPGTRTVSGLVVKNVIFRHLHRLAGPAGAVTLYGPDILGGPAEVDGVYVVDPVAGTTGTLNVVSAWIHLIPGGIQNTNRGSNGTFKNVSFSSGATLNVGSRWVGYAFIGISGEGRLVLEDPAVNPGLEGGTDPNGGSTPPYGVRIFYPWDEASMTTCPGGPIHIERGNINNCAAGIGHVDAPALSARFNVGPFYINRCTMRVARGTTNTFTNFVYTNIPTNRGVFITDCDFEATNLAANTVYNGIQIADSNWSTAYPFRITNNRVRFDAGALNPGASAIYIQSNAGITGSTPSGVITGNVVILGGNGQANYAYGYVHIQTGNGSAVGYPSSIVGVETAINTGTGTIVVTNGQSSVRNQALIQTP